VLHILGESFRIEVMNRLEAVAPAMEAAEAWLEQRQVPPKAVYFANLAIEEILTNCIRYGYEDDREHIISITLTLVGNTLRIGVIDDGRAFDPLLLPTPNLSVELERRVEGGLGIHLLRSLADRIAYERTDGTNQITLVKNLS
jgi:serine/threonine-protein kinase RsbW